ncbi:hypothetical protein CKO12_12945 [Chromatium okenii]|uniref:PocR ligand-binding domain-containing protein n=1 Tax=Chromatium okenii TaxID=61644 RepID=UPI0019073F2B|nr:PocR ligand-binding domain-containing protein [Chromatium okenii]MBK1642759.1 hypothetical protein [Chromatium okenii]
MNQHSNQKPILFVRTPQLEQMRSPLHTSWNKALEPTEINAHSEINLAYLIDFGQMNDVFSSYLEVIGLPVAIIDFNGHVLASSNWQRICMEFHRVHHDTLTRCLESDTSLSRQMQEGKEYAIYRCKNGLTDCATPIIIEGQHIANLFIGQFFIQLPEYAEFEAQCAEFGFQRDHYFQALAEVPVVDERKIPAILKMLVGFASQIAKQSLAEHRARIAYETVEKQVIERTQQLVEAFSFNETILVNSPLSMGVYAANGQCVLANNAYAQLVGATREALLDQNFNNIASWQQSGLLDDCQTALASQTLRQNKIQVVTSFGKNICLEYQISPVTLNGEHHLLIQFVDLTEHEQLEEQLRHFAFYDFLTGLPNRRLLLSRIEQASRTSRQRGNYVAILFIDLNKFKQLNDVHGHDIGDQLLIETGNRLLKTVRKHDTVARLGGDEFILLLEELDADFNKASEQAHSIAEKIRTALSAEYIFGELHYHSSASIGITLFLGEEGNPDQILKEADEAMYTEKNKLAQQRK